MDSGTIGKWLIVLGLVLAAVGGMIWIAGKVGIPFGGLPGDISVDRPGFSFRFPLGTSILVSIILTILLNVIIWIFRR
jgi:hypothetical protein